MKFLPRRLNPWPALLLAGIVLWAAWLTMRAAQPRQVFQDRRTIYVTLQAVQGLPRPLDTSQVSFLARQLKPNFPKPR